MINAAQGQRLGVAELQMRMQSGFRQQHQAVIKLCVASRSRNTPGPKSR